MMQLLLFYLVPFLWLSRVEEKKLFASALSHSLSFKDETLPVVDPQSTFDSSMIQTAPCRSLFSLYEVRRLPSLLQEDRKMSESDDESEINLKEIMGHGQKPPWYTTTSER